MSFFECLSLRSTHLDFFADFHWIMSRNSFLISITCAIILQLSLLHLMHTIACTHASTHATNYTRYMWKIACTTTVKETLGSRELKKTIFFWLFCFKIEIFILKPAAVLYLDFKVKLQHHCNYHLLEYNQIFQKYFIDMLWGKGLQLRLQELLLLNAIRLVQN